MVEGCSEARLEERRYRAKDLGFGGTINISMLVTLALVLLDSP